MVEQEIVGESPFAFCGRVDGAIGRDFLEEGLVGGLEILPEFFGAVDDGSGSECGECGLADGESPGFEVVAAAMGSENAAGAELGEWHLGEGGDSMTTADGIGGGAESGFPENAEKCCERGAVSGGAGEEALVEELVAGFTGPGSECSAGPVAEPVLGCCERIIGGAVAREGLGCGWVGGNGNAGGIGGGVCRKMIGGVTAGCPG